MDMQVTHCPICGAGNRFTVRYRERFDRAAAAFVARKTPDHTHFRIVQCSGCSLVYSNPILPFDHIINLYRQSEFIVESQLDNMARDYREQFEKIIHLVKRGNLLEVGCSNGFFLGDMEKYGFDNIYGVEPSREAVSLAPEKVRSKIVNSEFKEGLFPYEYFDVICFFQVFDHIVDPNKFLQTVHKYLKKGGIVFAIHHNVRALMPAILRSMSSTYDVGHIYLYDKHTMRKVLEKNGFSVYCVKNIANSYQLDHIARMLPLPFFIKRLLRTALHWLKLANCSFKMNVENMVCIARK